MKFNYTKGRDPKYMVSLHRHDVDDFYYFHYFKEAKELFKKLRDGKQPKDTVINLWDVVHDVRKDYVRL